jgi:hypothetical protein
MSAPDIDSGEPLARKGKAPNLYSVLGAVLHLEILEPSDEPRLEKATQIAADWIGPRLRWTRRTCDEWVTPYRPRDLEYISCYVRDLAEPKVDDPAARLFTANLAKIAIMDHEVSCNGAEEETSASPYLLRFCTEIPDVGRGELFQPYAVLIVAVPDTWPADDFRARVLAIASELRVRWGTAGLTYAHWMMQDLETPNAAIYAHARRHPGYDTGYFHADLDRWHEAVRSVSWLTFLGKDMVGRLEEARRPLRSSSLVHVTPFRDGVCLQAGAAPESGDINRLGYPRAYVEADAMIRPVRARDGKSYVFLGSRWSESHVTAWLRRFERRFV